MSDVSSWSLMEQRLLSLDREASSLGEQGRAALNIHGRKALDDRESELFGTDPMKQPLMVRMQGMNQPRVRRRVTRLHAAAGCYLQAVFPPHHFLAISGTP
eukprot:COSAG05_NODE_14_length_36349_cov_27.641655_4_plen_101_part_00